jgi:hypothetical protein
MLDHNLIQRFVEKEYLISSSMELFDEHALRKGLDRFSRFGKVKNLSFWTLSKIMRDKPSDKKHTCFCPCFLFSRYYATYLVNSRPIHNIDTYTVQRSFIPVVSMEARQSSQFLAILSVLNNTKLQGGAVRFGYLGIFLTIFFGNSSEKKDKSFDDSLLKLSEENSRLQSLAGDIQG